MFDLPCLCNKLPPGYANKVQVDRTTCWTSPNNKPKSYESPHKPNTFVYIARELCSALRRVPCNQQATVKFFDRYNALNKSVVTASDSGVNLTMVVFQCFFDAFRRRRVRQTRVCTGLSWLGSVQCIREHSKLCGTLPTCARP